jgi:hypothetical protein
MTSYTVIWDDGEPLEAGRLEVAREGIAFHGAVRELAVGFDDIDSVRVGRGSGERIGGRPSLVLGLRGGRPLRIGSLDGLGALNELAASLALGLA